MYMHNYKYFLGIAALLFLGSCKKLIEIGEPINTITTNEMFDNNAQAEWAINGVYSKLTHGIESYTRANAENTFSTGWATLAGGLSSDELVTTQSSTHYGRFSQNSLDVNVQQAHTIWTSAYKIIFDANAVIEGLDAATSKQLTDSVKSHIKGEALAIRAFCYFNLVNFYGDLPIVLTPDFNATNRLSRSPVSKVYEQIIADLVVARSLLSDNFAVGKNERVRITKWFAEGLLARAYLYTTDYQNAIIAATNVIGQNNLFIVEGDMANVFLTTSKEAIFQLKPVTTNRVLNRATPESALFNSFLQTIFMSNSIMNAFEQGDLRRTIWLAERTAGNFIPNKYKVSVTDPTQKEYYMVMRLAELYLIRAEAKIQLSSANKSAAIDDLNVIRERAQLKKLEYTLTPEDVIAAVEQERRMELFAEWGHRWFDLKRNGKAVEVLSQMPHKQPWVGDFQLLYPISEHEININKNLDQNPEYNFFKK